jgi:hypothetical protein
MTTVSADDFVASVSGFESLDAQTQTDILAYYLLNHGGATAVSAAALESLREALHLSPQSRMAQYLSENSRKQKSRPARYVKAKTGYVLERGYAKALSSSHLGRPSAVNIATGLRSTLNAIGDPAVRAYLEEAMACFEQNLLRSALIMTWCVAYGLLRSWLFRNHLAALNAETSTWKKPFAVAKLDDFQDLTEGTVIETARKVGALTKEQHKTLKALLDQRNSYAHPTPKPIKPASVEAYIHTVLDEVVPAYG